jgi:hypothetical protein
VLTPGDIFNAARYSGFDHVLLCEGPKPYIARAYGGKLDKAGRSWQGPRRATAEEAAQDYCDHINGGGATPAKQLRSAGHNGKRVALRRDEELEAALGLIRDRRAEQQGKQGYVYCITDGEFVKIGYSVNPQARVAELQTGNARPLRLVWYFAGTLQDEADMHQRHIENNVLAEWFRPSVNIALDFHSRCTSVPSAASVNLQQ